ncbi:MAG TPA: hypothetical protein VHM25_14375 [Polyangiaceae bacterium]|nr:hypothetical protein [Polyangiaceae bacterium]
MNIGVVTRLIGCGLLSVVTSACGGSDGDAPKPNCGTAQAPTPLEIADVSPAVDASMPNAGIVQTFTVVGKLLQFTPNFALTGAHTAGQPTPTPTKWTVSVSGEDTVYTSEPISWANAPAHVELNALNKLEDTTDHCVFALPQQMFKYDVTKP